MLTESFIISISGSGKATTGTANKDGGIHIHEYQPFPVLRSSFKKSSTLPNCLAVSASHVFAAQVDKAVIHVYDRERGNQEATVPFPEKISSLALIGQYDGAGILALGTEGGRVLLWEVRCQVEPDARIMAERATTCLAVEPSCNFLLTGSADSSVHVWSISALLSFSISSSHDANQSSPLSPQRTLSNHRAGITALIVGHSPSSANVAISAARDSTCLLWDYRSGTLLHTFLLSGPALCLVLDPADRAFYAGYEDGSIQLIDFYKQHTLYRSIDNAELRATPTQPLPTDRWSLPAEIASAALCLDVSYDGTTVLSGHQNGKVYTWDITRGRYRAHFADAASSITNIRMLPPAGFPNQLSPALKTLKAVKPRYENSFTGSDMSLVGSGIPETYAFTAQLSSSVHRSSAASSAMLSFEHALTHCLFPLDLLDDGRAQLATLSSTSKSGTGRSGRARGGDEAEESEVETLRRQLRLVHAMQTAHMEHAIELGDELLRIQDADRRKRRMKKLGRLKRMRLETNRRQREMGGVVEKRPDEMDLDNGGGSGGAGASSSTEEFSGSE
ncbi:Pre-rRNA-processing protein ipi3 [Lambiella insularis]|nr:Pre-rRNA-processing protein ipi3 [Lambiella insularis]